MTAPQAEMGMITKWVLRKQPRLADTTHGGTLGWEQRKRILKGGTWNIDFIWDATVTPEALAMDQGDEVTLRFEIGATVRYYQFLAIVENVEITDDETKDVIRGTSNGFVNGPITLF